MCKIEGCQVERQFLLPPFKIHSCEFFGFSSCLLKSTPLGLLGLDFDFVELFKLDCPTIFEFQRLARSNVLRRNFLEFGDGIFFKDLPQDTTGCSFEPKITKFKSLANRDFFFSLKNEIRKLYIFPCFSST
ncbi:hypothetical protein Scep_004051 [Stephania cephalantha]|uniref:Uncharacterized protein n=1 Tax=Stephania cephalantha TaxID=152367 RepID=A0AAP0PV02_9MAGN